MKLIVDNLTVARGARTVIDRVSLTVAGGEALVLTGRNGSGKTTLLRTISGFIRPIAGTVELAGGAADSTLAEQSHYLGHLDGTKSTLTVAENLGFWAQYLDPGLERSERESRVTTALTRFGLQALGSIPAGYLSAGQKRRVGLARLLVAHRPVWLLDEPTVSLDAAAVAALVGIIDEHVARGGIVLAATHQPLHLAMSGELRLGPVEEAA